MITKVPYDILMGKIINDNNYYRYDFNDNTKFNAILQYDCGVFFAFCTSSSNIKLNYKVKYHKEISSRMIFNTFCECVVMGKRNNKWYNLNLIDEIALQAKNKPNSFELNVYNRNIKYEEYQVCFPPNGKIEDIYIESDAPIEFKQIKNSLIFIGSSVASDACSSTHMNLCCYLYRKYNINAATVGLSGSHTFLYEPLMNILSNIKTKKIIVDLEHLKVEDFNNIKNKIAGWNFLCIDSITNNTTKILKRTFPEINTILFDGEHLFESRHLNALGTTQYVKELKNRNLI